MSEGAQVALGLLAVVLPLMALFGRGLSLGQTSKMVLAWIAIFGVVYVCFLFRGEVRSIWNRAKSDVTGAPMAGSGKELKVLKGEDGHFWVTGIANGERIRFLIDSGATVSMVAANTAERIKADIGPASEKLIVDTANGPLSVLPAKLATLKVGDIERQNFSVLVSPHSGDENLLGMNFLDTLSSWRVEGDQLILKP